MTRDRGFTRTLVYLAGMALLLLPLSYLGQPAVGSADQKSDEQGFKGYLADLRQEYELSQTSIGDIDPAGATMQLLLLGGNGFAINKLWETAHEAQKTEDWETLRAVLEQLVKLQPHYFKVWDFLAHNQSYNMSVEFDDYRARYKQVITGFNFLKQGIDLNKREPRLPHKLGWYIGHKIGRADERRFYRRLFQNDWMNFFDHATDNPDRTYEQRDNWLVAKEKYLIGMNIADENDKRGIKLKTTPSLFFKEYSHSQINYAEALFESAQDLLNETEQTALRLAREQGIVDPVVRAEFVAARIDQALAVRQAKADAAWRQADVEMKQFADQRQFLTVNKRIVTIGQYEQLIAAMQRAQTELDEILGDAREKLIRERQDKIPAEAIAALAKRYDLRSPEENKLVAQYEPLTQISVQEFADAAEPDKRTRAKQLAATITNYDEQTREIDSLRDPLNYNFWRVWVTAQLEPAAQRAHTELVRAKYHYSRGRNLEAAEAYLRAFCDWRVVLNKYPTLRNDTVIADDWNDYVKEYRKILAGELPADFVLRDIVEIVDQLKEPTTVPFPPLCGEKTTDEKGSQNKETGDAKNDQAKEPAKTTAVDKSTADNQPATDTKQPEPKPASAPNNDVQPAK